MEIKFQTKIKVKHHYGVKDDSSLVQSIEYA